MLIAKTAAALIDALPPLDRRADGRSVSRPARELLWNTSAQIRRVEARCDRRLVEQLRPATGSRTSPSILAFILKSLAAHKHSDKGNR
ncbi:hypothetical protein ACFPN2_21490 [Steroidobacter flavus]|uniref:Transposase n=1 Tax=Steroidobacter flavus TaxID=1842136 RepID=A0ABV8SVM2_9GAMM